MTAFELSIGTSDLTRRCMERLRNGAQTSDVVWQSGTRRLLVHTASLVVRSLDGWLVINLDVETDQTKKQTLQFVFYLGKRGDPASVQAACTINAPTAGGAQIADGWGRDLQRVLWDVVVDGVEACVARVSTQAGTQSVTLQSFFSDPQSLIVTVVVGA
jgi:hypothetical protein